MQPRPRAETSRPLFPSVRFCIVFLLHRMVHGLRSGVLFMTGATRALDLESRCGVVDRADLRRAEMYLGRSEIFYEPFHFPGAWDGNDPGLLREQPGERDLGR